IRGVTEAAKSAQAARPLSNTFGAVRYSACCPVAPRTRGVTNEPLSQRTALIVAGGDARAALTDPFRQGLLPGWSALEAERFDQARFLLQHEPCDVLLVSDAACPPDQGEGV